MIKAIRIGDTDVNMRASALTAVIYRSLFGKDLTIELNKKRKARENSDETGLDIFKQLAFVMQWQALPRDNKVTEDMKRLSIDDYYEWLDTVEEADFFEGDTLASITNLWVSSQKSQIPLKNVANPQ